VRATAVDAPLAFSAYGAAVDREECASHAYANFMKRIAATLAAESAGPPRCEPDDRAKGRRVELTIPERALRPPSSCGRSLGSHPMAWGGRIALVALFVFASISIAAQAWVSISIAAQAWVFSSAPDTWALGERRPFPAFGAGFCVTHSLAVLVDRPFVSLSKDAK
jgi:hypothetical protein